MASNRREFLKALGGLTAAAAAGAGCDTGPEGPGGAAAEAPTAQDEEAAFAPARTFASHKFGLELDGSFAGWLQSTEGGAAVGDVVTEKQGADGISRKHLANVKYEDITISCGSGMSKAFYEWIRDTLDNKVERRSGAIVGADFHLRERTRLEFKYALLSEVGMPALDASSKDAARMTVKFTPEVTRSKKGSGATIKFDAGSKALKWFTSSFRLAIDGLDDSTSRAFKVEAITIKQKVVENPIGETRDYEKQPAGLEFSDLAVTVPDADAGGFYDWAESFIIQGDNGQDREKGGTLEYTDPRNKPLFTLKFHNLGVFKVARSATSSSEAIERSKAEMYCEKVDFTAGG